MTRFARFLVSFTALQAPAIALAQDSEELCAYGPTNRDMLFSLGGTALITVVSGLILVQTLARSLAGAGFRQSAANSAAFGLAAFLGGAAGGIVMAVGDCGVANVPGGISLGVCLVGLIMFVFAIATGKS